MHPACHQDAAKLALFSIVLIGHQATCCLGRSARIVRGATEEWRPTRGYHQEKYVHKTVSLVIRPMLLGPLIPHPLCRYLTLEQACQTH